MVIYIDKMSIYIIESPKTLIISYAGKALSCLCQLRHTGKEIKMNVKLSMSSSMLKLVSAMIMAVTIIAAFPSFIGAQTDEDSATVRAQVVKYQSVWNTHDPTALAAFFTEDADLVMGNLPLNRGREAIENWWRNYFKRQEPERRGKFVVNSIRIITSDVALANIASTTGGRDTQGVKLPTRKARGMWMLHRQKGNWFIEAMRGMPTEEDRIIRGGDR